MARPRKFLMQNSDYRFYVQVYPKSGGPSRGMYPRSGGPSRRSYPKPGGPSIRLYLGTKDRPRAEQIGEFIHHPWEQGDADEVELRLEILKEIDPKNWDNYLYDCRDEDDPTGDFLEIYYPDEFDQIVEDNERMNHPTELKKMDNALNSLLDNGHIDLIEKSLIEVVGDNPGWFTDLRSFMLQDVEPKEPKEDEPLPSKETIGDCWNAWAKRARSKGRQESHVRQYKSIFAKFIALVSESVTEPLPVNRLKKKHFMDWVEHIESERDGQGARWYNEHLTPIAAVMKVAMRRMACDFPEGLRGWIEYEKEPYAAAAHNRQPMPVAMYHKLVAQADEWAAMDVDEYAATLPVKGDHPELAASNNVKQAKRIKRAGAIWSAILRLAANAGCDNVDICRLTPEYIRLDGDLPLFTLPRWKPEHLLGEPIARMTPLLPATVDAIKRWMDYERPSTEYVFSNDAKRRFVSAKVSSGFARLRKAAGQEGFDYKHLRNVGSTIGKRHKRHPDEREAFLGHAVRGTSRFYEGDVDETYLVDLVNLVGDAYFDGEQLQIVGE